MRESNDRPKGDSRAMAHIARLVRRLADQGQWEKILGLTADRDLLKAHFRLTLLRLSAAIECRDLAAIEWTVGYCLDSDVAANIRVAAASRLITAGYGDFGWRLIAEIDDFAAHPNLPVLLERIAANSVAGGVAPLASARRLALIARRNAAAWIPAPIASTEDTPDLPKRPIPVFRAQAVSPLAPTFRLRIEGQADFIGPHADKLKAMMAKFDQAVAHRQTPQVFEYRNVFVSRNGQIWKPDGTVIRSDRQLPARPEAFPEFDEAVLGASATRGFYHWFIEKAPSLAWRVEPGAPQIPILLGTHAEPFEEETLRLLGIPAGDIRRIDEVAFCRRLYVGHLAVTDLGRWNYFQAFYDRIVAASLAEAAAPDQWPQNVYVSRRDTVRRVLDNEAELEAALETIGVTPIQFGTHPLARQIAFARHARVVIGPHGAGLAHIVNMAPGSDILEMVPTQDGFHSQRFNFARLSRIRQHRHTLWLGPINPVSQRWTVNIARIVALTKRMIAE
jgi:hypothetical protein